MKLSTIVSRLNNNKDVFALRRILSLQTQWTAVEKKYAEFLRFRVLMLVEYYGANANVAKLTTSYATRRNYFFASILSQQLCSAWFIIMYKCTWSLLHEQREFLYNETVVW